MTGHARFLELAASSIDFELRPDERAALERHLAGCEVCRRRTGQIRSDARAIAALPPLRAGWTVPAIDLTRRPRRAPSAILRPIAAVAMMLAVLSGMLVVGAEIVRRQDLVVLPDTTTPIPTFSAEPSAPPLTTPSPTIPPAGGTWRVEAVDVGALPFGITSVTGLGSRLVAVGRLTCTPVSEPTACWATVFASDDGGRGWAAAPRSEALAVGIHGGISGPEPGMLDVAAGHGGFLAIGYDELFRAAAWSSVDGLAWTTAPANAVWDRARVRAVTATSTGWVVGGEVFLDDGPRAAIWTSPDGATWTRAPDGPVFDIGGYLDTGEEPGSGGISDVTSYGSMTIAVGSSCDDNGAACVPAIWSSTGGPWSRDLQGGELGGALRAVSPFGPDLVAVGLHCGDPVCAQGNRSAAVWTSGDGASWGLSGVPGTAGTRGFRALAAGGGYLVGVIELSEGVDGINAGDSGELALAGSVDGRTWEILDGVPDLGLSGIRNVALTATSDGSIIVVGWGDEPRPVPFRPFVVVVNRIPG